MNSLLPTSYLWRPFKGTGTIKNQPPCAYQDRQLLITPCRPIDPGKAWRTGENRGVESSSLAMSLRPVYTITEWEVKCYDLFILSYPRLINLPSVSVETLHFYSVEFRIPRWGGEVRAIGQLCFRRLLRML